MIIRFKGDLYLIYDTMHRTPGNQPGFVQAKMRNLSTGALITNKFWSEDRVERVILEEQEMEFLYEDGEFYHFMNTENYEQVSLHKDMLGEAVKYLVPQAKVKVLFHEGKPVSVELPPSVELTVVETEPGLRSATVSNVTKPAKLETGLVVQVPSFINAGDKIRVSTADGSYLERAS